MTDFKGALINISRELKCAEPEYSVARSGPPHMPLWTATVHWRGRSFTAESSQSMKAQQQAAEKAFTAMNRASEGKIIIIDYVRFKHFMSCKGGLDDGNTQIVFCDLPLKYPTFDISDIAASIGTTTHVVESDDLKKVMCSLTIASGLCQAMSDGVIPKSKIIINVMHAHTTLDPLKRIYPSIDIVTIKP